MKGALIIFFLWGIIVPPITASEIPLPENPGDSVFHYVAEAMTLVYNDFPGAILLLEKADSLAKVAQKKDELSKVAHSFGLVYYIKGDYGISLDYFLKASESYREQGDKVGIAKGLIGQGLIQQGIERHSEAISLFNQAIQTFTDADAYEESNPAYLDIAISEIELKDYDNARKNLEVAIKLSRKDGRKDVEHLALNKLGEISFLEGDVETSIQLHNKVLFDDAEPNGWEKSFAHAGLAQAFHKQGNHDLAIEHGQMAMEFAEKAHSLWDLERNSKILANVYQEIDSMDRAVEYLKLNQKFQDSLYNQVKLREINLLQLESKEAENLRLLAAKEIAEKKLFINKVITFLLILVSLFLISLLILFYKKRKQKEIFHRKLKKKNKTILHQNALILERNKELDEINKSKDKFFSILSHDLRSPIGSIQQLLEMMKSGDFSPEEQSSLLDEMLKQISGTSFMLHNLLHWAGSQLENSKPKPEILNLTAEVEKVLRAYYWPAKQKNIEIFHETPQDPGTITADKAQLSVILHNLISNAIKFTIEGKNIKIFYRDKHEFLQLIVKDRGNGMSEEKIREIENMNSRMPSQLGTGMETGTGLGLLLVKEFLKANKAALEIKSTPGKGSEFIVSFLRAT